MADLIPFVTRQLGMETVNTVNARDLYAYLGILKRYTDWIKTQIRRAHLIENRDYIVYHLEGNNPLGGRPASEHHLTFDAAKHVAMMSSATKGHEVREYFIQKEKELANLPTTRGDLLVQMAEAYRLQEHRLLAVEAEQDASRQQRLEDQAALIASQQQAIAALQLATGADSKADLALEDAHRMTLEEFVLKNGLVRQFPPSHYATYTTWLRTFCRSYGLSIQKAPVYGKSWDEENSYPLAALAAWLRYETKKPQQVHLVQ